MKSYSIPKMVPALLMAFVPLVLCYLAYRDATPIFAQSFCEEEQKLPIFEISSSQYCDGYQNCTVDKEGNGLLINPEDLLILTAYHVIVDNYSNLFGNITVKIAGSATSYQAELLAFLPAKDLAILQISREQAENKEELELLTHLKIRDLELISGKISGAEKVFTLGQISGESSTCNQFSVSQYHLSSNRICIEHKFNTGDSGLPVFRMHNSAVELVGIVHRQADGCVEVATFPSETEHFVWIGANNTLKQGWGKNIQLQGVLDGTSLNLTISMELYLANTIGDSVNIVVYPFDSETGNPLLTDNEALRVESSNQLALNFGGRLRTTYLIDSIPVNLARQINLADLTVPTSIDLEAIRFVVYAIKQGPQAISLGSIKLELTELVSIPTPSPAVPPTPIIIPTDTPTVVITPTGTPSPTPLQVTALAGRIAYSRFNSAASHFDIYIYCLSTQQVCQRINSARQPDFSAGGYLVFNGHGNENNSITRIGPDYSNARPISLHPEDAHPHWSPDGNSIIFGSTAEGPDHRSRIYRLEDATQQPDAELKALRYINALIGHHPIYLSNRRVAYQGCDTWLNSSNCGIYTVTEFGDVEPVRYTTNTDDTPTDNIYDSILFTSKRDGNWDVYIARGPGNVQRLTDASACDGMATASPDGSSIAFMSDRSGVWGIYVMNLDGTNQRPIVEVIDPQPQYGCDGIWLEERMSWGP